MLIKMLLAFNFKVMTYQKKNKKKNRAKFVTSFKLENGFI